MANIGTFIQNARKKGLSDDQIRKALANQGWDADTIDVALTGLEIPKAESPAPSSKAKHPTLSPLMAALHHVLLWFFTASSTVTIIGVVASLSGYEVSSQALAAMIAVTVITFTPYAALFILFLAKGRRTPGLVPGKVWSIITVCLHSIGAMIAAIVLVVALITDGDSSVSISAALVLGLDLIVVVSYCFAAFSPPQAHRVQRAVTVAYLPVLAVLFGVLFVMSIVQLAPVRHDEQLRKDLVSTVQQIDSNTEANSSNLPENGDDVLINPDSTYRKIDRTTYEVCGNFKVSNRRDNDPERVSERPRIDDHISESTFDTTKSGTQCFIFTSLPLQQYLDAVRQQ